MAPPKRKGAASTSPVPSKSAKPNEESLATFEGKPKTAAAGAAPLAVPSPSAGRTVLRTGEAGAPGDEAVQRDFFQGQIDAVEIERAQVAEETHPEVRVCCVV